MGWDGGERVKKEFIVHFIFKHFEKCKYHWHSLFNVHGYFALDCVPQHS